MVMTVMNSVLGDLQEEEEEEESKARKERRQEQQTRVGNTTTFSQSRGVHRRASHSSAVLAPFTPGSNANKTVKVRFGTTQLLPSVEVSRRSSSREERLPEPPPPAVLPSKYSHQELGNIYPFSYSLVSTATSGSSPSYPYSYSYEPAISRHIDISSSSSIFYTVPFPKGKSEVLGTPSILKPFRQLQEPTRFNTSKTARPNIYVPPVRVSSRTRKSESNSEVSDSTTASVRSSVTVASQVTHTSVRSESRQTPLSDSSDLQVQRKPLTVENPRMPLRVRMRRDEYYYTETSTKATQTDEAELKEKRRRSSSNSVSVTTNSGRRVSKAETVDRSTSPISPLASAHYLKKLEDLEKITGHFVIQRFFTRTDQDFTHWLEQQLASRSAEQDKYPDDFEQDDKDFPEGAQEGGEGRRRRSVETEDVPKESEDKSQIGETTENVDGAVASASATRDFTADASIAAADTGAESSEQVPENSTSTDSPLITDVTRPDAIDAIDDIIDGVSPDVVTIIQVEPRHESEVNPTPEAPRLPEDQIPSEAPPPTAAPSTTDAESATAAPSTTDATSTTDAQPTTAAPPTSEPEPTNVAPSLPEAEPSTPAPATPEPQPVATPAPSATPVPPTPEPPSTLEAPPTETDSRVDSTSATPTPEDHPQPPASPTVVITSAEAEEASAEPTAIPEAKPSPPLATLPEEEPQPDGTLITEPKSLRKCTLSDLIPCECFAKHFLQEESIAKLLISLSPRTSTPIIEAEVVPIKIGEDPLDSFQKFQAALQSTQQQQPHLPQLLATPKPEDRKIKHSESFAYGTAPFFLTETTVLSMEGITCQEFPPFVFPQTTAHPVKKSNSYDSCLGTEVSSSGKTGNESVTSGRIIDGSLDNKVPENLNISQDSHSQTLEDLKASIDEEATSKDSGLGGCSGRSHWFSTDVEQGTSGRQETVTTIYEINSEDNGTDPLRIKSAKGLKEGTREELFSADSDTESEIVMSENYHARSEAESDTEMTTDGDAVADDHLGFGAPDLGKTPRSNEDDNTDVDDDDKDNDLLARMELDELRLEIDKPSVIRTTCTQTNRSLFSSALSNGSSASSTTTNGSGSYIDLEVISKKYPSGPSADATRRNYLPSSSSSLNYVNCNMNFSVKTDESKFKMSVTLPGLRPKQIQRPLNPRKLPIKSEDSQDLPALWAHVRNRLDSKVSLDLPASDLAVKGDSLPGGSRGKELSQVPGMRERERNRESIRERAAAGKYQRPQHQTHQQYFLQNRQNDDRIKRSLERLSKLLDIEK